MTSKFTKMALFVVISISLFFVAENAREADGKAVKIVEEPAVYRGINAYYQQRQAAEQKILARVKEKPFTGAAYFKSLDGKCFSLQQNEYKYELCPFHNVTQKEESSRWNAFSGVLGIWKEWIIVNNTFQAMLMDEGDLCGGNTPREAKVFLKCAEENKLKSVKEPQICKYELVLDTPLACPLDSLLVFPALSPDEQMEWLDIERALYQQELTPQGYNKCRRKLFVKAGFLPKDDKEERKEAVIKSKGDSGSRESPTEKETGSTKFSSLHQCSEAYKKLETEARNLRELLNITKNGSCENAAQVESHTSELLNNVHRRAYKNESAVQEDASSSPSLETVQTQKNKSPGTASMQTGKTGPQEATKELHVPQKKK